MNTSTLSTIALACAAPPSLLYLWNSFLFRAPPAVPQTDGDLEGAPNRLAVSVLIPARNEAATIGACIAAALDSRGVEVEVVVVDDHSLDRTVEVVGAIAAADSRVRLERAPPLPDDWCGKQHACFALAGHARFDLLMFLDADVKLAPDGIARMVAFLERARVGLVSGFPRQEMDTPFERLVLPLINWMLLSYLPMFGMRWFSSPIFGVGCGQWFATTRAAYDTVGGHAAVRSSLHDGLTLPRAYRRAGYRTDICDGTDLAVCRMYHSAGAVWTGLAKNAREGMAATGQIGFWTLVLLGGQVLPAFAVVAAVVSPDDTALAMAATAFGMSYFPRLHAAFRFRQSWLSAVLHPLGVLVLLAIQWYAAARCVLGRPVGWKGRKPPLSKIRGARPLAPSVRGRKFP